MGIAILVLCSGAGLACDSGAPKEEPSTKEEAAPVASDASAAGPTDAATPAAASSLLDGILPSAIEPPPEGGSTYRIDAYVAALVVEQLRRDPAPFSRWSDGGEPGTPTAGYQVGAVPSDSLWGRMGLLEGDVVEAINGVPMDDEGWAAEALGRSENRITITVFREGISSTLSFRLMGGMAWSRVLDQGEKTAPPEASADDEPDVVAVADAPRNPGGGGGGGGGASRGRGAGGKSRPSSPGGSRPSSGGKSRPSSSAVARCSSPSACTIDKPYFDSLVRSPSKLESQANVVPAIRNDVHSGYKLKTVRSGTAVHQLGFRSGDKITHINGRDLTNDIEAMQLYMGLSSTRTFRVRYVRGGSTRNKTISVK